MTKSHAAAALLLTAALAPALAAGCKPEPLGEMVLIIKTDMAPPKDFDTLVVLVFNEGELKFKFEGPLPGDPKEEERVVLPSTLGLVAPEDPTNAIRIEVGVRSGGQDGPLRVVREVVTTVPGDRVVMLHMPIQFLCKKAEDYPPFQNQEATDIKPADCPNGKTCIAGICETSVVDSAKLPDYDANTVFGGSGDPKKGKCFDVARCFENAELIDDTTLDTKACSFAVPKSIGIDNLNLALGVESDGICNGRGCFVTLDAGTDTGWKVNDGQTKILLPKGICQNLTDKMLGSGLKVLQIVQAETSASCPQKTESYQSCGPWSAVESPPPPKPLAVAIAGAQDHPISVALVETESGGFAYWTNSGGNTIKGASLNGGPLVSIDSSEPPRDILTTDKALFWTTSGANGQGLVYSYLANPGAGESALKPLLMVGGTGTTQPEGIAFFGDKSASKLFWTEFSDPGRIFYGTMNATFTAFEAGGAQVLASDNAYPARIAADSTYVYWTNEGTFDKNDGSVARIQHANGGAAKLVLTDMKSAPRAIALDVTADGTAKDLYFATIADGTVWRISDASATPPGEIKPVATGLSAPNGIAIDGKNIYIANRGDGTIVYKAKDAPESDAPQVLADGQKNPGTILVKNGTLLWVNEGPSASAAKEGSIIKLDISKL